MRGETDPTRAPADLPAGHGPVPAVPDRGVAAELDRLKLVGVLAPIAFLIGIETFRFVAIDEGPLPRAEHLALAVVTGLGVVVFALLMFALIERAQRRVLRQNRELAAMTAVSSAVQGELGVEQILDAALRTVADATGASRASVTVFAQPGSREPGLERALVVRPDRGPGLAAVDLPQLIDVPLSAGTAVLGRLRLHLPTDVVAPDLLATATLQNIGHQLACAIQIGQLVADLQRRKSEGHGLYDILLRISNQEPLEETLRAVARHASTLVGADAAVILLNPPTVAVLGLAGDAEGGLVVRAEPGEGGGAEAIVDGLALATLGTTPDRVVGLPLASPELPYGEIRVGRSSAPFTGRERGFISTLAELASIAISAARLREHERQAAVVAERDRIAREMHDSLAQVLGVTHLRLRALRARTDALGGSEAGSTAASAAAIGREVEELADLAEEAYRDVREAILGLREAARVDRSFVESLRAYLEKYGHQAGIAARLETELHAEPALAPRAEVQVIRVIQEALTNVRKHADATSAVVRLSSDRDGTILSIEDDGRGFDLGSTLLDREGGFGLHTMRERMELVGGTLEIESARGRGTRVIARLPAATLARPAAIPVAGSAAP